MSKRVFSHSSIDKRERKRLFILKFRAMHDVNKMTWDDCAAVYEAETGHRISGDNLRNRVKRAAKDVGFIHIAEFPERIVVSIAELTFFGCFWCALRRFWDKIRDFFTKKALKG